MDRLLGVVKMERRWNKTETPASADSMEKFAIEVVVLEKHKCKRIVEFSSAGRIKNNDGR